MSKFITQRKTAKPDFRQAIKCKIYFKGENMSNLMPGYNDPVDKQLLELILIELNITQLKEEKEISRILEEDILPMFPKIAFKLSDDNFNSLIRTKIIDASGNLLALGKGYLASLIRSV